MMISSQTTITDISEIQQTTNSVGVHNVEFLPPITLDSAGESQLKLLHYAPIETVEVQVLQDISPLPFSRFCNSAAIFFLLFFLLSSCTNTIPEPKRVSVLSIPDRYTTSDKGVSGSADTRYGAQAHNGLHSSDGDEAEDIEHKQVEAKWWESFGSRELNELIENALGKNFTLREAWARLKQAKALQENQNSSIFPTITFDSSVARRESGESTGSYNTFSAGPEASYEIDLWGNVNARILEYEHKAIAARFDLETAAISLSSAISNNWVELITVREEISLVKKQVEINSMLLELLELRFQNSMSTALDVLQQREVVARSRARIPPLEIREVTLLNAIALLCGRSSRKEISIETPQLSEIPPMPQMGIPVDLLSNRPDIKSAAFQLTASQWAIFQARADRLPSLNLTGSFLFQHTTLDNILENWILALASRLSGTLFDGGKKSSAIDLASGVMDERLVAYEKMVFTAIMEVENSIAAEKYRTRWIDLLKAELTAAKLALEEARNRYIKGMDPFIPVVTEELNVQNLEMDLLEQKAALFKDRIALCRAIGGRWTEAL